MNKEYHSWHSPILGVTMPLVSYGHFGQPILMFPTAAADCEEYERFHLISSIQHHIDAGRIKVFSIDSINKHSWMSKETHPAERARRQALYDSYVYEEVAPFIWDHCKTPGIRICTSGASFGAFHALNTVLKHPDRYQITVAMSGAYDVRSFADGYYDDNIYFNNPVDYMPRMEDHNLLQQIRNCNINIVTGQGKWEVPEESRRMSTILWNKGIWNNLDMWGYEWDHDWPTWRVMLDFYINKIF
ncbi:MAG TPA: alpha/beta hydrolase-fold protein [Acidobacteriota bacterium]|nr:alpha/beta hydrolase-fold protein [Acidobacteriota bacterium]